MPIPITDAQLIEQGKTLLIRLGRHLDAVEKGDNSAGDDLAAVLRILIDSKGKGNQAMLRLARATNHSLMDVHVSGPPEIFVGDSTLLLSFGNLPVIPAPQNPASTQSAHVMTFRDWMETPSLIVPSSQRRKESWGSFATLVANTSGSHASLVYHDLLETSDLFGSVGLSLQTYFLRQIGWVVEQVLTNLLVSSGTVVFPRNRQFDIWPRLLTWGWFKDDPGVGTEMSVEINVTSDAGPPVEVMRYMRRDRLHHMYHHGQTVSLTIDEPTS